MSQPLQFLIKSAFDATGVTAAANSIKSIDTQINKVSRGFSTMMKLMGAGGIGAAVFSFGKSAVNAYAESEKGVSQLAKAMQNLGSYSAHALKDQLDYAGALQKTTKYSDEQVMTVQSTLTAYGLYGEKLKAATLATLNLATQTGDSASASKIIGKAYQGQTDTLAKMGIKISDTVVGSQKFDAVLEQLNKRFGGFAENEGKSYVGQLEIMTNRFDELKEKIGKELMPVANAWLGWLDWAVIKTEKLFSRETDELKGIDLTIQGLKNKIKFETEYIRKANELGEQEDAETKKAIVNLHKYMDALKRVQAQKLAQAKAVAPDPVPGGGKRAPEAELDNGTASWLLNERNTLMLAYYKRHAVAQKKFNRDSNLTEEERGKLNKKVIRDIEAEYLRGSKSMAGGLEQALEESRSSLSNWKDNWSQVISASIGPATEAFKEFFNMSKKGFLDMGSLAEGVFKGIRDAFFDMIMQMAAKAAVYGFLSILFPGSGFLSKGLGSFLGFAEGGPIPGKEGAPVPILAHGGEFMLSADVVKAIKSGAPTSGLSGGALASRGAGANITYNPTININGGVNGGNVREICRQIADAGRKGVTEALDAAKVLYKQGAKRSMETAL